MLNLKCDSPDRWIRQVKNNLEELLVDHAHCEKKAAGVAMNLMFAYVNKPDLCRELSGIVKEELEHFEMVLDLLEARGMKFRKLSPCRYASQLHELIRKLEPGRAVDRLLVAGLIEARSCERFSILRDHLEDVELSEFFGSLFESEARHYTTYVKFAKYFATEEDVNRRFEELATAEAEIIQRGDENPRVHS